MYIFFSVFILYTVTPTGRFLLRQLLRKISSPELASHLVCVPLTNGGRGSPLYPPARSSA